jgi:hypothetical protein
MEEWGAFGGRLGPSRGCVVVDVWMKKLTLECKRDIKNPEEKWIDLIA